VNPEPPPIVGLTAIVEPSQTVTFDIAIVGRRFTVTFVVAVVVQPLAFETVNVYTPPIAVVALALVGSSTFDVKLAGPFQLNVKPLPPPIVVFKVIVEPSQTVTFDIAIVGRKFTVTFVVAVVTQVLAFDTVNVYVPPIAVVALARLIFAVLAVKLAGPFHEYVNPEPPPIVGLTAIVEPSQTVTFDIAIVGRKFTVTFVVAVVVQPLAFETVNV
jgi:hypothetical protein